MDLNFILKSIGFGIRRPGFTLALHESLGHSDMFFSPVQMERALLSHKNKKDRKRKLQ